MQNDRFGRLLKGAINSIANYEGKTAPIIEDELGQKIGISAASIQRYKAGHIPPEISTVQILAEAAMHRGFLNRDWLQNFLEAAQHPAPDKLLDKLYPNKVSQGRPIRVYHNLPAPSYSQFIMRPQAYAEVLDGLMQRSAAVIIISLGGMGKTSLAREIAAHCLQHDHPKFEAAVWISDKDHPGMTHFSAVLDEIARTLDYPGFTQFEAEEKRREVEHLLRRQKVLVIVDNFETIADKSLLYWLLRLPEPSKALITTREYRPEFRRGGWPVELGGMQEEEAQQLIAQRLRLLKMDKLVSDSAQLVPLIAATGGNAKALELALGCLKYDRQSLQKVVANLQAAKGELFDDLFSHSWELLSEQAHQVLLAMSLFPEDAQGEALSATAALTTLEFEQATERLTDLTLLDVHYATLNEPPRYALHPLVRAFVITKWRDYPDLETTMRQRWADWYIQLAEKVGYCWNDLSRLELLDPEQENLQAAAQWTLQNRYYSRTLQLARAVGFYYYVRGLWEKKPPINLMGAEAARYLADPVGEIEALGFHIQLLSKQSNLAEAEEYLPRLQALASENQLPPEIFFMYKHTLALYWLAAGELTKAQVTWQESLQETDYKLPTHLFLVYRQWLGICLYQQGKTAEARKLLETTLAESLQQNYKQGIVATSLYLASLHLDQQDMVKTIENLSQARTQATQAQYRDHQAQISLLYARLYCLQGNEEAARLSLNEAIDQFERLGMRAELAQAKNLFNGGNIYE